MNKMNSVNDCLAQREGEVKARIQRLKRQLNAHDRNIALLKAFHAGRVCLKGKGYTHGAACYQPTLADKQRLPRTLANLNRQRDLLMLEMQGLGGSDR